MDDRELPDVREPINRGPVGTADRSLPDVRSSMPERVISGRELVTVAAGNFMTSPDVDTTNRSDAPVPLYGTDNPFAILGDIFSRGYGGGTDPSAQQTQYVPVVASSGGGGNAGLVVVVLLLAVGAAYYYFVYRKRNG